MITDTIAAIATGMTDAGIGIIRISGNDSFSIIDKIFKSPSGKRLSEVSSHTIHYGHIVNNDEVVDEVLVSVMRSPHTFTGEDTVEINCHGGVFVLNKVLNIVLSNNARLATPGEFTKRAFLNGKMDMSKAEAVMDLIASKNDFAVKNSVKSLSGNIFDKISDLRKSIVYEIAFIESALDDPEHFDLDGYPEQLDEKLLNISNEISNMIENGTNGKIRKDGITTVIVGKPNAGKSSFLNLLLGENRAIVTSIAGTTRDILEETARLDDIILHLIDTAGIRETEDEVEKIGVDKAKSYVNDADLLLYMVDSSVPLDENDDDIIDMINTKKSIVLLNKSDLNQAIDAIELKEILGEDVPIIRISAKENIGIEEFKDILKKMFFSGNLSINDEVIVTNTRQINELRIALDSLKLVRESISNGMPEDFFSIDLQNAYEHLGYIIGEEMNDDVVNEIFAKFCMGK